MHLTHICPRFKESHGGGEPVLFHLFGQLCNLGFENTLCTYNFPPSMRPLLDCRVELKELPKIFNRNFGNVLLAGFYDLFCSAFFAVNTSKATDAVCFHTESVIPALFFYKMFGGRKPTLYFCFQPPRFAYDTTQETAQAGGLIGLLVPVFKAIYRPFDKATVRRADMVATFSQDYSRWIEGIYHLTGVRVLPPGVERPQILPQVPKSITAQLSQSEVKALLFVGKFVAWKNVDRLINITALVRKRFPNVCLLIVGDGPCMASLKRQATGMGLEDRVIFCGYVSGKEVFSYCALADLLILLEQNASFGLSLIEANAMGLPVMAFQGGGPSDIIEDGQNGFLLPVDSTDEDIAELIIGYFGDEEKTKTMRSEALGVSAKFTWPQFAQAFGKVVRELTRKGEP